MPSVVVIPENTEEIAKVLKYCNIHKIPVTPAGARTGLSGGALPIYGGVLLSTEKLNRIINIDEKNHQVLGSYNCPRFAWAVPYDCRCKRSLFRGGA